MRTSGVVTFSAWAKVMPDRLKVTSASNKINCFLVPVSSRSSCSVRFSALWPNHRTVPYPNAKLRTFAERVVRLSCNISAAAFLFPPVFRNACWMMLFSIPANVLS